MVIGTLLLEGKKALQEAGIESYALDAEALLCHLLKKDRVFLSVHRDEAVDEELAAAYKSMIERRKSHEPIAYITGEKEFMSLSFSVSPGVLIPRPDTETLVEFAIDALKSKETCEILDLCTGSGAIAVSLAYDLKKAFVTAYDVSSICVDTARKNAEKNGVDARVSVVLADVLKPWPDSKQYDCIVSNPPYIPPEVIQGLAADVRDYEPLLALDGGDDGLLFYRHLARASREFLKPGGLLAFEIGYDQGEQVKAILQENEFCDVAILNDLAHNPRVVYGYQK